MFGSKPKEKYEAADLDFKKGRFKFNNSFMHLLVVIVLLSFTACSKEVRVVVNELLPGELGGIKFILGELTTVLASHKPSGDGTAHHVSLAGKKKVHHQAQEHKLIPDDSQTRFAAREEPRKDSVELQNEVVGNAEWQEEEPVEETCQ